MSAIHQHAVIIQAHLHHLHPRGIRRRPKRFEAVHRHPNRTHDAPLSRAAQGFHRPGAPLRPISLRDAVQQHDIQHVRLQFPKKSPDSLLRLRTGMRHRLRSDHHRSAIYALHRGCHVRMTPVHIRRIPKADPLLVGISQQPDQRLEAEVRLIRTTVPSGGSRADAQFGYEEPGLP